MMSLRSPLAGRRFWIGVKVLAVLIVLWLLASCGVAYLLTRRSRAAFPQPAPSVSWARIEPHRLKTSDGLEIGAWYVEGPDAGPSILLLHGNGGTRASSLALMEMLSREGCSVLAISLRAHGDSDGARNDIGYSARRDVEAAVAYLEQRRPGRPIVVQGSSLGAAAAIYAAGDVGGRVCGYILEAPYRDIYTAVRNRTSAYLPRPLSNLAYAGLVLVSPLFLPDASRMSPVERIADIPKSIPILLLAGGQDDRARPEEVEEMRASVASHSRLLQFEGSGHVLLNLSDPARYQTEILGFIQETMRVSRSSSAPVVD